MTVPLREVQEMHDTMLATFLSRVRATPDRVALEELAAGGAPADLSLTWTQWREASRSFAAALIADGVQRGDRVAILAGNRALGALTHRAGCRGRQAVVVDAGEPFHDPAGHGYARRSDVSRTHGDGEVGVHGCRVSPDGAR